jgi:hypothetical protein
MAVQTQPATGKVQLRKYPFVAWERLKPAIQWKQSQHVVAIGGTGSGKSTLSGELLPRRKLVVVCVSKGMDEIFQGPYFTEYDTIAKWSARKKDQEHVLLRPANQKTIELTRTHKTDIFRECFDSILLKEGYWCIDIDESHYLCERLKLGGEVADLMEQGRSAHISVWNNTQRPAGIPLAIYVNSMHGFFFLTQEEYDLQRLSRMGNKHTNVKELSANIQNLDTHEFVYIDKTGRIPPCRSIVTLKGRKNAGSRNRQVSAEHGKDRHVLASAR